VERIVEIDLTADEHKAFLNSADAVRGLVDAVKKLEQAKKAS
jgi:malate/lactate dehydrogenase